MGERERDTERERERSADSSVFEIGYFAGYFLISWPGTGGWDYIIPCCVALPDPSRYRVSISYGPQPALDFPGVRECFSFPFSRFDLGVPVSTCPLSVTCTAMANVTSG